VVSVLLGAPPEGVLNRRRPARRDRGAGRLGDGAPAAAGLRRAGGMSDTPTTPGRRVDLVTEWSLWCPWVSAGRPPARKAVDTPAETRAPAQRGLPDRGTTVPGANRRLSLDMAVLCRGVGAVGCLPHPSPSANPVGARGSKECRLRGDPPTGSTAPPRPPCPPRCPPPRPDGAGRHHRGARRRRGARRLRGGRPGPEPRPGGEPGGGPQHRVEQAAERYNEARVELETVAKSLAKLKDRLAATEAKLADAQGAVDAFRRCSYRAGGLDPTVQLLRARIPMRSCVARPHHGGSRQQAEALLEMSTSPGPHDPGQARGRPALGLQREARPSQAQKKRARQAGRGRAAARHLKAEDRAKLLAAREADRQEALAQARQAAAAERPPPCRRARRGRRRPSRPRRRLRAFQRRRQVRLRPAGDRYGGARRG